MTSQPGKETITMHILLDISRGKVKQTLKFGQLIEHNMRSIFLEKPYRKHIEGTTDSFLKNRNWAYLWINSLRSFILFVFIVCQFEGYRNMSPCLIFCLIFEEKYFSRYALLTDHISLCGCLYFVRYWAKYVLWLFVPVVTS